MFLISLYFDNSALQRHSLKSDTVRRRPLEVSCVTAGAGSIAAVAHIAHSGERLEQRWGVYAAILCALVIVVIHNGTALGMGYYGGKLAKAPVKDCRTLAIEIGIQNSGLALALLFNPAIFSPDVWGSNGGMVIVAALWGIWHIVAGLVVSYFFRRSKA